MPSSYVHLGLEERRRIHHLREAKVPVAEIAADLGRHRSTIHREIARNWWHDVEVPQAEGYWPLTAQDLAVRRRRAMTKLACSIVGSAGIWRAGVVVKALMMACRMAGRLGWGGGEEPLFSPLALGGCAAGVGHRSRRPSPSPQRCIAWRA